MNNQANTDALQRAASIKLLLLDVDGILTDGRLYYGNDGAELKAFSILDGLGIKLLQKSGIKVGIITGRKSDLVARRASELGIRIVVQGREDKWAALQEVLEDLKLDAAETAFMGDDLPDLPVIRQVGLGMTVPNAHTLVQQHSHWQSSACGGEGAVREACEYLMQAQGTLEQAFRPYLTQDKP